MFEIELRYNRPFTDQTRNHLNPFLDDEGIGLLRWRGDEEHVVLTLVVRHADSEGTVWFVMNRAAMLWPHVRPERIEVVR